MAATVNPGEAAHPFGPGTQILAYGTMELQPRKASPVSAVQHLLKGLPMNENKGPGEDANPFGPNATQILATEHWSLLGSRALIWNEAMSRTTVFLSLLSAAIIALALLADATGFGPRTTTLAMVLLPVVLFLGIATHIRLVQINSEEVRTVLAMNRLRKAYLEIEPGIEPYLTTGHHDDEKGLAASYLIAGSDRLRPWAQFLQATATIVATVDAALATAIVVLALQAAEAPIGALVGAGTASFLTVWGGLFSFQRRALDPLRRIAPRFPTPSDGPK